MVETYQQYLPLKYILCNYYTLIIQYNGLIYKCYRPFLLDGLTILQRTFLLFLAVQGNDKLLITVADLGIYIKPLHKGKHK